MHIRISVTVHRIFEVDPRSYSDDGITPEPHDLILQAELKEVVENPIEFLQTVVDNIDRVDEETIIVSNVEVQEVTNVGPTN